MPHVRVDILVRNQDLRNEIIRFGPATLYFKDWVFEGELPEASLQSIVRADEACQVYQITRLDNLLVPEEQETVAEALPEKPVVAPVVPKVLKSAKRR